MPLIARERWLWFCLVSIFFRVFFLHFEFRTELAQQHQLQIETTNQTQQQQQQQQNVGYAHSYRHIAAISNVSFVLCMLNLLRVWNNLKKKSQFNYILYSICTDSAQASGIRPQRTYWGVLIRINFERMIFLCNLKRINHHHRCTHTTHIHIYRVSNGDRRQA